MISSKVYHCGYKSRAHPKRATEFSFQVALQNLFEEIDIRNQERALKWERKIQEGEVEIVDVSVFCIHCIVYNSCQRKLHFFSIHHCLLHNKLHLYFFIYIYIFIHNPYNNL
jgi:hypothetical protein